MHRFLRRLAVLGLVLTSLCAWVPNGLSLCFAEDGHVSVELSHEDDVCFSDARRHHGEDLLTEPIEAERHPCEDITLSSFSDVLSRSASEQALPSPELLLVVTADTGSGMLGVPPPTVTDQPPLPRSLSTALLRTIVLTI